MLIAEVRRILADWLAEGIARSGERPWKVTSLAKRAGVSRATIYGILNREQTADDDTLGKLAGAMGWPVPTVSLRQDAPTPEFRAGAMEVVGEMEERLADLRWRYTLVDGELIASAPATPGGAVPLSAADVRAIGDEATRQGVKPPRKQRHTPPPGRAPKANEG